MLLAIGLGLIINYQRGCPLTNQYTKYSFEVIKMFYKSFRSFSLVVFVLCSSSVLASEPTQIVVVQGVGETVDAAIKNGAENALVQVVGALVEVNTQLTKRKKIKDGVASVVKTIDSNFTQASNGTIKKIEVLSTNKSGGIYRTELIVTVRMDDLKKVFASVLSVKKKVSGGVFAQALTNKSNSMGKLDIILESVVRPIASGKFITVELMELMSFDEWLAECSSHKNKHQRGLSHYGLYGLLCNNPSGRQNKSKSMLSNLSKMPYSFFVLPLKLRLNTEVLKKAKATVSDLSTATFNIDPSEIGRQGSWEKNIKSYASGNYVTVCFANSSSNSANCHIINGLPSKEEIESQANADFSKREFVSPRNRWTEAYSNVMPQSLKYSLRINFKDVDGNTITSEAINYISLDQGIAYDRNPPVQKVNISPLQSYTSLITNQDNPSRPNEGTKNSFTIFDEREVDIFIPISGEQLELIKTYELAIDPPRI